MTSDADARERYRQRTASWLLPDPGGEVVRDLLDRLAERDRREEEGLGEALRRAEEIRRDFLRGELPEQTEESLSALIGRLRAHLAGSPAPEEPVRCGACFDLAHEHVDGCPKKTDAPEEREGEDPVEQAAKDVLNSIPCSLCDGDGWVEATTMPAGVYQPSESFRTPCPSCRTPAPPPAPETDGGEDEGRVIARIADEHLTTGHNGLRAFGRAMVGHGYHARDAEVATLTAEVERLRETERDSLLLFGPGWQQAIQSAKGDPEAAEKIQIGKLVGDLAEMTAERDALAGLLVRWLRDPGSNVEDRTLARETAAALAKRGEGGVRTPPISDGSGRS